MKINFVNPASQVGARVNNKYKKIALSLLILIFCGGLLMPSIVDAAEKCDMHGTEPRCPSGSPIRLQVGIPGFTSSCEYDKLTYPEGKEKRVTTKLYCVKGLPEYITSFYKFFISIVGILAVIMIMAGGFQWLMAAGSAQKISGAKTIIISAIMGLVLTLTSYTILNVLNPDVLNLKLKPSLVTIDDVTGKAYKFCDSDDSPMADLGGDNMAMCGKKYQYPKKNPEDEPAFCNGFVCDGNGLCLKYENNYSCVGGVNINDPKKGYGNQNWVVDKTSKLSVWLDCGVLYQNTFLGGKEQLKIGNHCAEGGGNRSYCVVGQKGNVKANFEEDYKEGESRIVGNIEDFECIWWYKRKN